MANVEKIKHNLMWRGWSGLQAGRLAEEIGRNLDNYLLIQEAQAKRYQKMRELSDNQTRSIFSPTQTMREAVSRGNI